MTPRPSFAFPRDGQVRTPPQRERDTLGGLVRSGAPPEQITEARRCLKFAKASAYLRELAKSAPEFTAEQTICLTRILCNPAGVDAPAT
jgi:hypothetical protein